jgi:hypothetical protein
MNEQRIQEIKRALYCARQNETGACRQRNCLDCEYDGCCFLMPRNDEVSELLATLEALPRERAERENPKPLTLDELLNMDGQPIWTITIGVEMSGRHELCTGYMLCVCPLHRVLRCVTADGEVTDYELETYGKTWLAYATEPKGDESETTNL